jgi:hypothetical protein
MNKTAVINFTLSNFSVDGEAGSFSRLMLFRCNVYHGQSSHLMCGSDGDQLNEFPCPCSSKLCSVKLEFYGTCLSYTGGSILNVSCAACLTLCGLC